MNQPDRKLEVIKYAAWVLRANAWDRERDSSGGPTLFKHVMEVLDQEEPAASEAIRNGKRPEINL